MKKLLIFNDVNYHYETIESVIVKYRDIIDIEDTATISIYLHIHSNDNFKTYICNKYPNIILKKIDDYDYYINCTIYDNDYDRLDKNKSNRKYISHEITERLKENPNVFFLTPLSEKRIIDVDILPYMTNKWTNNIPIFIIQGNITEGRRYYNLLVKLLEKNYMYDFKFKMIGRGLFPKKLEKYKNKIIFKNDLNFTEYHKEFLDCYCILPLISKTTHPEYYSTKLTSTINYAKGYNLKCLIDSDLQKIYKLTNAEVFNDINDISIVFSKALSAFYENK